MSRLAFFITRVGSLWSHGISRTLVAMYTIYSSLAFLSPGGVFSWGVILGGIIAVRWEIFPTPTIPPRRWGVDNKGGDTVSRDN